jgi:hypothetical protein
MGILPRIFDLHYVWNCYEVVHLLGLKGKTTSNRPVSYSCDDSCIHGAQTQSVYSQCD